MTGAQVPPDPTQAPVADATGNWVERAPRPLRGYLRLSRLDRPIGTWLLLLPCWWALALAAVAGHGFGARGIWIALGCGLGAVLMRGAGCTWNDIADRDIDGRVARTANRPIPSGQVRLRQALAWMGLQSFLALLILLTFGTPAIALGVASLALVAVYPFAKRFTWWPQAFLGLAFNWGALLAWAALTGTLGWAPVALYAAGIAWTLFYDTIYALQDVEDDALIGVRSSARRLGARTVPALWAFLGAATGLMALSAGLAGAGLLGLLGALAFGVTSARAVIGMDPRDLGGLLARFRAMRGAGLAPLPFWALAAIL
ncbi:MAG: 4-hydroxybenzoate octaprenyltransferase [Paracoccaceae bacterium]